MRLGILGGTFDPPTLGHLVLAEEARWRLALERVLFVPAGEPWRKEGRGVTPAAHRLEMTRLATADNASFQVSDLEIQRAGPSFTADTLGALHADRPEDELFFIVGEDALRDLPNWHNPAAIIRLAWLAVAPRGGWSEAHAVELERVAPGIQNRIVPVLMPTIDIADTDIRRRVAAGDSIHYLVPAAVEDYIQGHHLYRT